MDGWDREEKESKGRTDEPRRKAGVTEVKVNSKNIGLPIRCLFIYAQYNSANRYLKWCENAI